MTKAKKKTASKTWAWGVQTPKGTLTKSTFRTKSDAKWDAEYEGEGAKPVKVWITIAK